MLYEHIREISSAPLKEAQCITKSTLEHSKGCHYSKGGIAERKRKEFTDPSSRCTAAPPPYSADPFPVLEKPATPPPTCRALSPSPPSFHMHQNNHKAYLTIADLYKQYIPLKLRPTSKVLPTLTIQDLLQLFGQKQEKKREKPVISHTSPQHSVSVPRQHSSEQPAEKQQEQKQEKQLSSQPSLKTSGLLSVVKTWTISWKGHAHVANTTASGYLRSSPRVKSNAGLACPACLRTTTLAPPKRSLTLYSIRI